MTWFGTNCNSVATSSTSHVAFFRPSVFRNVIALDTWQEVAAIVATCCNHITTSTPRHPHSNATTRLPQNILILFHTHPSLGIILFPLHTHQHISVLYRHSHINYRCGNHCIAKSAHQMGWLVHEMDMYIHINMKYELVIWNKNVWQPEKYLMFTVIIRYNTMPLSCLLNDQAMVPVYSFQVQSNISRHCLDCTTSAEIKINYLGNSAVTKACGDFQHSCRYNDGQNQS